MLELGLVIKLERTEEAGDVKMNAGACEAQLM
jgi:hypothetical protein